MNSYRPVSETRRIGLLGGTFDPIHYGHLVVAEEVRAALNLIEMIFVPAGQPPHKQGEIITPAAHRLAMLELAITSNPHFSISLVELDRPGPSYTVDTLRLLRQQWGAQTALYFVIGWDGLEELSSWYDPEGILEQVTHLVAIHRPGYEEVSGYRTRLEERLPALKQRLLTTSAPQLDISATDLRQRVAEGRPIKYQTPEAVEYYIAQHGLYRQKTEGRVFHGTHAS
ncbi:MAG: nicotinate-nucleotide adenylyltransferase [Ktedonobacteraceae bacterium]